MLPDFGMKFLWRGIPVWPQHTVHLVVFISSDLHWCFGLKKKVVDIPGMCVCVCVWGGGGGERERESE